MDILSPVEELAVNLTGIETLFNCAGIQHPKKTDEIYRVNRDGAVNLLQAAIKAGVKNFIHISSSTIYGTNADLSTPLTELSPLKYSSHYTKSKIQGDELLIKNSDKGTKVVIIAPAVFYGHPASNNLRELMELLKNNKIVPLVRSSNKGGYLRSYVSLNKVIEIMLAAENKGRNGQIYLAADKQPLTTLEFYKALSQGLKVEPNLLTIPTVCSRITEKMDYLSGQFNIHLRYLNALAHLGRHHFVNPDKAEKELGVKMNENSTPGLKEMAGKNGQEKISQGEKQT